MQRDYRGGDGNFTGVGRWLPESTRVPCHGNTGVIVFFWPVFRSPEFSNWSLEGKHTHTHTHTHSQNLPSPHICPNYFLLLFMSTWQQSLNPWAWVFYSAIKKSKQSGLQQSYFYSNIQVNINMLLDVLLKWNRYNTKVLLMAQPV